MAVYEVDRSDLEGFVDEKITGKDELAKFREELIDLFICDDVEEPVDFIQDDTDDERNWPYEKKEPSQFYVSNTKYHICVKDMVFDFFENIICGGLLKGLLSMSEAGGKQMLAFITIDFISFVRRIMKEYVVKLDDTEFCVYLQVITHFKERENFTADDIKAWLPEEKKECNMCTNKWKCPFLEEGKCYFKKEKLGNILKQMETKKVLEYLSDGMYKITF